MAFPPPRGYICKISDDEDESSDCKDGRTAWPPDALIVGSCVTVGLAAEEIGLVELSIGNHEGATEASVACCGKLCKEVFVTALSIPALVGEEEGIAELLCAPIRNSSGILVGARDGGALAVVVLLCFGESAANAGGTVVVVESP